MSKIIYFSSKNREGFDLLILSILTDQFITNLCLTHKNKK